MRCVVNNLLAGRRVTATSRAGRAGPARCQAVEWRHSAVLSVCYSGVASRWAKYGMVISTLARSRRDQCACPPLAAGGLCGPPRRAGAGPAGRRARPPVRWHRATEALIFPL